MDIYFGTHLDSGSLFRETEAEAGVQRVGPQGLLYLLESVLGLAGHPSDTEYLRLEAYRQTVRQYLASDPDAFFAASFQADQFATAADLLSRRDELLAAGWDFRETANQPHRLTVLSRLETMWEQAGLPGYADRMEAVLRLLPRLRHPFRTFYHLEPFDLLPRSIQRLLALLPQTASGPFQLSAYSPDFTPPKGDLGDFREALLQRGTGKKEKIQARGDGSLLLLTCPTAIDGAEYLAQLLRHNSAFRPALLIPEKNRVLDAALIQEGLPSLGIQSASLARPSLQILKLIPAFLWTPIDPYKILEFVSLPVKPLPDDLAQVIAAQMSQSPGLQGENWNRAIARYFDELRSGARGDRHGSYDEANEQYRFWFGRKRYPIDQTVPRTEVIQLYEKVRFWAFDAFEAGKGSSLLVLSEQAKRIVELLSALPEEDLSHLELERIVRTIYQPSPVVFHEAESTHLPYVHHPGAFLDPVEDLVWWNFVETEPVQFFSRWYPPEIKYLEAAGVSLDPPALQNQRQLWQRIQPVLKTGKRLLLIIPRSLRGDQTTPHPLMGDLEATFSNLGTLHCELGPDSGSTLLQAHFQLPKFTALPYHRLGRPKPFIQAPGLHQLADRENETFSSLNALFYYPYQWVFQYKLKLKKSSILSIVPDETLMGNLAHRLFEKLFEEPFHSWDKPRLERWVEETSNDLFYKEGAVLLLYGREPERIRFLKQVQFAAWTLTTYIRNNQWTVESSELPLEGQFAGIRVKGIADVVLKRGEREKAVLDLKWRGANFRENSIRNEEDLQLVLYSNLACEQKDWAHTAYFIINRSKLLTRTNHAFGEVIPLAPQSDPAEVNARIWSRMEHTFRWRMRQLSAGAVEVRCQHTLPDLDLTYQDDPDMLDILEMKTEDARFDDYRTLINLIQ
ncbi:MAG: PD-(D/E)XK nuclease family protein [Lewinellaceae bacterium]|nr:PD-(D/E)XK nuclease family protein [Lewinellaceae bacterium]